MPTRICRTHCPEGDGGWLVLLGALGAVLVLAAAGAAVIWLGHHLWHAAEPVLAFVLAALASGGIARIAVAVRRRGPIPDDQDEPENAAADGSRPPHRATAGKTYLS